MPENTQKSNKLNTKKVLYLAVGVLIIALIAFVFMAPSMMNRKLQSIQFEFQGKDFQLQNDEIKFQPFKFGFELSNFEIFEVNDPANHLFNCQLLSIQNINLFKLIFNSEINAGKVKVDESNTKFDIQKLLNQDSKLPNGFQLKNFSTIVLDEVVLSNARIAYSSFENIKSAITLPKIDLIVKGLKLSSNDTDDMNFEVDDFLLRANNFSVKLNDETHQLKSDELSVSLIQNAIVAKQCSYFANRCPKQANNRKSEYPKNYAHF